MVVFDYNFIFLNEKSLSSHNKDKSKKNIEIIEYSHLQLSEHFFIRSPWVTMTLRNVRYYSNKRFEVMPYNDSWALEIENIVTLVWDGKNTITYCKGLGYTPALLQFWTMHTFFPLILEIQRHHRVLHVGGVQMNGEAILFSALSFGGKSTLTEYFLNKNHTILGDDTIGIMKDNNMYSAIASYPFCRPYRQPETLGNPIVKFADKPLPLKAIYYLEKVEKDACITITELQGVEKFKAFHYSSFVTFDFLKKEHMDFFAHMAKNIPIYSITIPWDLERLEEVYQVILKHNNV